MKKYARIFLTDGGWHRWLDIPMAENVTLPQFMSQVRFEGYVQAQLMYVPLDQIKCVIEVKLEQHVEPTIDFTKSHGLQ